MAAVEEGLRDMEDRIETLRDLPRVRKRSQNEFLALYEKHGYTVAKQEPTVIPVSLSAWLALTDTPAEIGTQIESMMRTELDGGLQTGFRPYLKDGELCFEQRWVLFIGRKVEETA